MNVNTSMREVSASERLTDNEKLAVQWKSIDWKQTELEVNRLQVRIAKATQ